MKQFYLKCLFFGILSFIGIKAVAYNYEIDDIYYNLNESNQTATVTYYSSSGQGSYAHYYSDYKDEVIIPESFYYDGIEYRVTCIGQHAFQNCSELKNIVIPNSVTNIEGNAFQDCIGLTTITIPNSVTNIDGNVFYGCRNLTSLIIGNNVASIGYYAFSGCSSLKSIVIPNRVTFIGGYAFYY